jgi:hypothetical protein
MSAKQRCVHRSKTLSQTLKHFNNVISATCSENVVEVLESLTTSNIIFTTTNAILVNKRNDTKIFFKDMFMLKPKQLFIIIYVNVCVKRVYPHKTNNNILFRYGQIPERQFSVS